MCLVVDLSIDEVSATHEGVLTSLLEMEVPSNSGPTLKDLGWVIISQ